MQSVLLYLKSQRDTERYVHALPAIYFAKLQKSKVSKDGVFECYEFSEFESNIVLAVITDFDISF